MLDLYKLKIFRTAATEGSLTAAAERLLLSQPGVSQHIKDLEASLGVDLFKRGRRGVTLTPAGQTLFDYTRCIFKMLNEAENAVVHVGQMVDAELHIGATQQVGIYLMPEWMRDFQQRYANLRMRLHTAAPEMIQQRIRAGELDISFVDTGSTVMAGLRSLFLQDVELRLVVGPDHPWVGRESVPLAEVAEQPFLATGRGDHRWLDTSLDVVASFDSLEAMKRSVSAGMGIALAPACAIGAEEAAGQLVSLNIDEGMPARHLSLVWSEETPPSPVARAFLVYLSDQFPQIAKIVSERDRVITLPGEGPGDSFGCIAEE